MTDFTLLNFEGNDGAAVPGIKVGKSVLSLAAAAAMGNGIDFPVSSTKEVLWHWDKALPALGQLAARFADDASAFGDAAQPLDDVRLLAPVLYPDAIFCAFANFTDHMQEMSGRTPPDKNEVKPLHFIKLGAHCVVGPEAEVKLPSHSQQVDWEAELAAVIGRLARNVSVAEAMDYVAGYTILNDLSLRDQGNRKDWGGRHDFMSGKSFDTGAPMGPWIVPKDQIADVYNLDMKQWVADKLEQDSNSSFMHFTIAEQVADLSRKFTLRPGDVISTGSPSGNGRPQGIYLKPGQDLTVEIEGIGTLHNPLVQGE
jgi:2-keto-4-pentenoate hydratase/2-oxohepta-3-ene-1,7-dioic acid hydratase in catechol pathway